jgi:hypothetical protein
MAPFNTFCLAAIVFLSLPLPVFASAVLGVKPSARRFVMPWVWAHAGVSAVFGLTIITEALTPLAAVAIVGTGFVICGTGMFRSLATSSS